MENELKELKKEHEQNLLIVELKKMFAGKWVEKAVMGFLILLATTIFGIAITNFYNTYVQAIYVRPPQN